jgi:signal transduction histidine kinase
MGKSWQNARLSPSERIRFPLRRKVLLPVATMIIVMMALALFVVNKVVHNQVQKVVSSDLEQKIRAFDSLQRGQLELLAQRAVVVAETPHLRAAIETSHPETVQRELERNVSPETDSMMIVLDAQERILAYHGPDSLRAKKFLGKNFVGQATLSGAQIGVFIFDRLYLQTALVPVIVPDALRGKMLIGFIVLGYPIESVYLNHLQAIIGSEFVFSHGEEAIQASTGFDSKLAQTASALFSQPTNAKTNEVQTMETSSGEYLVGQWQLSGDSPFSYILLIPFGNIFKEIVQPVEHTILWIAAVTLVAAILISYFISRMVVSPVQRLVSATDAVSAGDYAHPIAIHSQDEIGYLAGKFDMMRQSLQKQMAALASQNKELEDALQQLEKAQQELVQSEKLAATGKITAQLSHELNNPIHNVRSCLESARRKIQNGKGTTEYLDLAHEEIVRMGKLVQQMLAFYRPPAVEREPVNVNRTLKQVLQMSRERFVENNVIVASRFAGDLPEIQASPDQLKQVFLNIIMNAIDAMPDGGKIEIATKSIDKIVEISFRDNGIGIEQEKLPNIFDAFYTTKSRASGVGLGLSVSYGIVKSLGGKIMVASEVGEGAMFTVQLPVG